MADDNTKELQQLNKEQATTNKQLVGVQKSLDAMASALGAQPKDNPEDVKEAKSAQKAILNTLQGILKATKSGIGEVGGGMLDGIKKMFSKYKKIIITLLGAGLLAMFSQLNMKQVKEAWTAFKEALDKVWKVLKPLGKAIGEWVKDNFLPNTVKLLIAQFKTIGTLFDGIKTEFEGWDGMTWQEKVKAVIGSFGKLGTAMADSAIHIGDWALQLLGYDGQFSKDVKKKWEEWFGESKEGGILSTVGGMFKSIGGLFLLGSVIGGKTGMLLQAPLKAAILGGKKGLGLVGSLAKGIGKAMPAIGKGSKFATGILGSVAKKAGILGLAYSVGEGAFAAYDAYQKGGTVDEVWQAGISKFLTSVSMGLLSEKTANSWAKNITGFFGSVYDAMFGDKIKKQTEEEIRRERELRSGKKWNDMTPEQKRAAEKELRAKFDEERRGGKGSTAALAKGDVVGLQAQKDAIDAKMKGISDVQMGKKKQDWSEWYKLQAQSIQLQKDMNKLNEIKKETIKEEVKVTKEQTKKIANQPADMVIGPQHIGGSVTQQRGVRMAMGQTRASSWNMQTEQTQLKTNALGKMFKGGIRITSGYRDQARGTKAMINSVSPLSKYKEKWRDLLDEDELNAAAGTEARKRGVAKLRAGGMSSEHEHGNAIDFSYPVGYSEKSFPALKKAILDKFPGANLIKEKDHLHMSFNKANIMPTTGSTAGVQLASLQADAVKGGGGQGGNVTINNVKGGDSSQNAHFTTETSSYDKSASPETQIT